MLPAHLRERARARARRAWRDLFLEVLLLAVVLACYAYRRELFGTDVPVRITAGLALALLGWVAARQVARVAMPILVRRGVEVTGSLSFIVRLVAIVITVALAFGVVGVDPTALAAGGAMTAIIVGLAAQQTLGNLFAGIVLLTARPFRIAERVRLQGGPLGGIVEGVIVDLGLLYTTLARGEDKVMVPNSLVLNSAVVPLREPGSVDVRARVKAELKPTDLQSMLEQRIDTPVRQAPQIHLEEVNPDEVMLRVTATPAIESDGPKLADEVLTALREAAEPCRDD